MEITARFTFLQNYFADRKVTFYLGIYPFYFLGDIKSDYLLITYIFYLYLEDKINS